MKMAKNATGSYADANKSALSEDKTLEMIENIGFDWKAPFYSDPQWVKEHTGYPKARSEHNPNGLSMASIDTELRIAFCRQVDHYMFNLFLGSEHAGITNAGCRPGQKKNVPNPLNRLFRDRTASKPTAEHLVRDSDAVLADIIRTVPVSLLKSLYVQDALCRWTFAARWGDPDLRNKAKALLGRSLPPKTGSPAKIIHIPERLLGAYNSLCAYVKCITKCADAVQDVQTLVRFFGDTSVLERHGLVLEELFNKRLKKPAPSDVAVSYIAELCSLSKSRVKDLVSAARKAVS